LGHDRTLSEAMPLLDQTQGEFGV